MNRAGSPSTKLGLSESKACIVASRSWVVLRLVPAAAASPAISKNAVSVAPGQTASTRIPKARFSAHSASVNDKTKAFDAP